MLTHRVLQQAVQQLLFVTTFYLFESARGKFSKRLLKSHSHANSFAY